MKAFQNRWSFMYGMGVLLTALRTEREPDTFGLFAHLKRGAAAVLLSIGDSRIDDDPPTATPFPVAPRRPLTKRPLTKTARRKARRRQREARQYRQECLGSPMGRGLKGLVDDLWYDEWCRAAGSDARHDTEAMSAAIRAGFSGGLWVKPTDIYEPDIFDTPEARDWDWGDRGFPWYCGGCECIRCQVAPWTKTPSWEVTFGTSLGRVFTAVTSGPRISHEEGVEWARWEPALSEAALGLTEMEIAPAGIGFALVHPTSGEMEIAPAAVWGWLAQHRDGEDARPLRGTAPQSWGSWGRNAGERIPKGYRHHAVLNNPTRGCIDRHVRNVVPEATARRVNARRSRSPERSRTHWAKARSRDQRAERIGARRLKGLA